MQMIVNTQKFTTIKAMLGQQNAASAFLAKEKWGLLHACVMAAQVWTWFDQAQPLQGADGSLLQTVTGLTS